MSLKDFLTRINKVSGKHCKKHTPIVSKKQRGLFGAELARKRAGKKGKTSMSETTLKGHLEESKGKKFHNPHSAGATMITRSSGKNWDFTK